MDEREKAIRQRLKDDLHHYAEKCLRIRTKSGAVEPLILNRAQRYIHDRLEAQRDATGYVRALILKGRQQGCSTYVGGRFYWRTSHRRGVRTFILTHEDQATQNLFEMANRYHEHCPAMVKPSTGYSNAKELIFDRLDSGYKIGTAKTKGTARSSTLQYFHGSEVAFWANAAEHRSGAMQAVPDAPDTEVILESTANGYDPMFFPMWQDAEAGQSEYIAVFVPWYWQDEYRKAPAADFKLTADEQKYADAYGLDLEQMAWRRAKIAELKDPLLFKQEYPATAAEAFQVTGHESFIPPALVLAARKNCVRGARGAHIVGVDPARGGKDRTAMIHRKGRAAWGLETDGAADTMHVAGRCRALLEDPDDPVDMLFVDVGGIGAGVYDRLVEMGYGERVRAVNFGSGAVMQPDRAKNRRVDMWLEMKDWLGQEAGAEIPDSDELQADLTAPGYKYDSEQRYVLESKEEMAKRGVRSPDCADSLALTFAEPVAPRAASRPNASPHTYVHKYEVL